MSHLLRRTALFGLIGAAISCQQKIGATEKKFNVNSGQPLVSFLNQNRLELSNEEYLKPSEVFMKLSPAKRRGFLKKLIRKIVSSAKLEPMIQTVIEASFGVNSVPKPLLGQLSKLEDEAVNTLVEMIFVKYAINENPQILDTFPTVPIESLPAIQQALFSAGTPTHTDAFPRPFKLLYQNESWQDTQLKKSGCERLTRKREPVDPELGIYEGMEPIREYTEDCYKENSEALAKLMNMLANTINDEPVKARIRFEGKERWVESYADLYRAFQAFGFTTELSNTRVLVDFGGWSFKEGNKYSSIRGATHFRVPLPGGQTVRVPAEHGELDLMIRRGSQRFAGMQWFFGIPDSRYKGVATFWRPHLYLQAGWANYVHEFIKVFPPSAPDELTPWLTGNAYVMRGFQAVYDRFQPPLNSYGLFICSDSMTFAMAKHLELTRGERPTFRVTQAFPTLYAGNVMMPDIHDGPNFPPGLVDLHALFANYAMIGLDTLDKFATRDTVVAKDPEAMKHRLQLVFEPKDDDRLTPFPEFRDGDLRKIRN